MAIQPSPAPNSNLLALPDGTELVGDYHIKRVLGAGGFGITYLADEMALARLVTIKEYFPAEFAARSTTSEASPRSRDCAADYQWGLERFIEEAQTLARFVHPNIVRVYRYFRANNTGYMVLHFEEGGSFKAWLRGLKRAPRQPELDRILKPLLEALEMVHAGDFLHRDIAPDNIIIRKDGSPVLIDFGSARGEIATHSKTVSALVKPGYSPYEQYATDGRRQGPWTDIYALGATLYHAVSGKRPPDAPSRMVNDEYIPAHAAALSSYRASFLAAIDKALRLEVGERPQSIAQWRDELLSADPKRDRGRLNLARALERLRTGEPTRSPPPEKLQDGEQKPPLSHAPAPSSDRVPAPPDAPQPKGQLLDFIDALKRRRSELAAKKAAPVPPTPALPATPRQSPGSKAAVKAAAAAPAKPAAPDARSARRPVPAVLRRPTPRPRPVRSLRIPARRWRRLLYRLAIGLGIAGIAVAYQDKFPHSEGRGVGVVSSQPGDLQPLTRLTGHRGAVTGLALGDDGRWIVSAGADATLRVWNAGSGAPVRTIELDDGPATAIAVDDRRALTGHKSGAIVLWDLERAEKLTLFQYQPAPVTGLAFAGDGDHFAAASQTGAMSLFDVRSPSVPTLLADGLDGAQAIAGSRSLRLLASAGQDHSIRLWRTDTGGLARSWRGQSEAASALEMSPGGRSLATGSTTGAVRLWSTSSSRPQRAFRAHAGRVTSVAFARGDRLLASAGEDGEVKLWDVRSGRQWRAFRGHAGSVNALAFSSDGRRLLSAGEDGVIRLWNTAGTWTAQARD
ncbi:MAG TPA: serine/threonine-protein kinase [Hyphomicrobiaceae bacterium]|jgi:serine/threonine protein kinase